MAGLAAFIIILILILALLAGALVLLYWALCVFLDWSVRKRNLQDLKNFPEGSNFTAHTPAVEKNFSSTAAVLTFWEDLYAEEVPVRTGKELYDKITESKEVLKSHGIRRRIRMLDVRAVTQKNGSFFRKWNHLDKEWQAGDFYGAMLLEYADEAKVSPASSVYFPTAHIYCTMSRRLRKEEKAKIQVKDKWGRKMPREETFYQGMGLKNCPSCGAELPQTLKDAVCPYCGSTIFSDYYDWQIESIEIEPETAAGMTASLFRGKAGKERVRKKKGTKQKIIRFSENDFRKDVLESCREEQQENTLLDLYLGVLKITSVRNTEQDTVLSVRVPVYQTVVNPDQQIISSKTVLKADFSRVRYPARFNEKTAVFSKEKECPNCGGPFLPDEKGCCTTCGAFLFQDQLKWRRVR